MTPSERVYRVLLVAYPVEHRRRYGDPMVQLFRDRLRRDGGGLRTILVWAHIGSDLARSAFAERLETAMTTQAWTSRWWEATVVILAANSVIFGVVAVGNGHPEWAIATNFAPAALLIAGLALRNPWRTGATVMVVAASLAAAAWFWMIYPVVLAAVVIIGGLSNAKIGPRPVHTQAAT